MEIKEDFWYFGMDLATLACLPQPLKTPIRRSSNRKLILVLSENKSFLQSSIV